MKRIHASVAAVALCALAVAVAAEAASPATRPSLKQALTDLKVPPDWFDATVVRWDVNKPWKDGRLEVRRLMALGEEENRQAVKITWLYAQKGDIGNGHELPMYLFMSGNYAWAAREYEKRLPTIAGTGATHEYLCYASCLAHFGEHEAALAVIDKAMKDLPPSPWRINSLANIHNRLGDLYAEMGEVEKAKAAYAEAMRLYPTSNQPYGRHLLQRNVAKVKSKLDLLTFESLATATLRDGTYKGSSLGYVDTKDIVVTLTVRGGKIADIRVDHAEKIDLGATKIVPQAIIAKQSLKVDAVTGATVTSQAIVDAAYQALQKAGLK